MSGLDIAISISLLITGVLGWRTGVIKVISSALGIILGVVFATRYGNRLVWLENFIESDSLVTIAGFCVIFLITFIGSMLLANAARKVLSLMLLAWVDSAAGAIAGVFTASIVWVAIIAVVGSLPFDSPGEAFEESKAAEVLTENTSFLLIFLPDDYKDVISFIGADYTIPLVSVKNLSPKLDENGMKLGASLMIENSNPFGANLRSLEYELYSTVNNDDQSLGQGSNKDIYIKRESETLVDISINLEENIFNYDNFGVRGNAEIKFPLSSKSVSIPYDTGILSNLSID